MAIYAIISQPNTNAPALKDAITANYPIHFPMEGGVGWLVATSGPASGISDKLGITNGTAGAGIVVEVASYFGRANPNIWSWIKTNWEAAP